MTTDDQPLARGTSLDHLVLIVADPEESVRWYGRVVGLAPERLEQWRAGEVPFVSLRIDDTTVIDLLQGAPEGQNVDHMAIVVEDVDLDALASSGEVKVVMGPSEVWGARGIGAGLYVSDPDGHLVELRTYPDS
jgi:catechol 2,3-dioxygenase-like lactoylglutathione lyase family enzyme